jgi:hypothetical protein
MRTYEDLRADRKLSASEENNNRRVPMPVAHCDLRVSDWAERWDKGGTPLHDASLGGYIKVMRPLMYSATEAYLRYIWLRTKNGTSR